MCCGTDICSIDCLRLIATLDDSRRLLPTNLLSHLSWVSITTLQVLAASSTEVPAIRRELQSKYSVHVGGLDSTQPRSGLAENTLHEVADLLDGMVKRAEQGRGSITALRAAVSNFENSTTRRTEPVIGSKSQLTPSGASNGNDGGLHNVHQY
eukprot:m.235622 g.235622  ORF g.235622 m.235622 type:complete len:153 (+) comp26159_c0_seq5:605-1063(+)